MIKHNFKSGGETVDTTRRYPRTLAEAFGPYHHLAPLHTEYEPMHREDKLVLWACAAGAVCLALILVLG